MKRMSAIGLVFISSVWLVAAANGQAIAEQVAEDGRVVYDSQPVEQEYRLALSGLKKVNNQWRVSREQKIRGTVERKTVELANNVTFSEAKTRLRNALSQVPGATIAFTCEGLDCGSSSGWANHIFGNKILYGLDQYQYYVVMHVEQGNKVLHGVYYLVQRGSGRVYLQQELVRSSINHADTNLISEASFKKQLTDRGYWTVLSSDGGQLKMSDIEVDILMGLMAKNRRWRIAVVGHNYQALPLDEQKERSLLQAKIIEKQLLDAGASAERIDSYGLGSLAPAGRVSTGRVELVLLEP